MREAIAIGDQVFVSDGDEGFGAVRLVAPHGRPELVIYVENAGRRRRATRSRRGLPFAEGHLELR